MLNKRCICW